MSNVTAFVPNEQALGNIPHMLRYWADTVERDQESGVSYEVAVIALVKYGEACPAFCVLGSPAGEAPHPLYVAGVLDACRAQIIDHANAEAKP